MSFIFLGRALVNEVQHVGGQLGQELLEARLFPLKRVVVLVRGEVEQGRNGVCYGNGLK